MESKSTRRTNWLIVAILTISLLILPAIPAYIGAYDFPLVDFSFAWGGWVGAPMGLLDIALGIIALVKKGSLIKGNKASTAGILLGIAGILLGTAGLFFFPNFLSALIG